MREGLEHVGAELGELLLRHRPRENEPVVLVGSKRLFPPPLAAHHEEAARFAHRSRRDKRIKLVQQPPVEVRDDFADKVDLDALPAQQADLRLDSLRRAREVGDPARAVDPPRDELRIAGEEAHEVDVLEHADKMAVFADRDASLVGLGHAQERGRDQVVRRDADDRTMRQRSDGTVQWDAVAQGRVEEIRAGDDSDASGTGDEQRVDLLIPHQKAGFGDRLRRIDKDGGMMKELVHPRPEQRREARLLLLARHRIELVGDVEVEERGEARVPVDQPQRHGARQKVAERFFARDEGGRAAALHQRARIEHVARAPQGDEIVAVALLDRPLDDDVEAVGRAAAGDDGFVRPVVGDVERIADDVDLLAGQPVERRVARIEMLRQTGPSLRPGGTCPCEAQALQVDNGQTPAAFRVSPPRGEGRRRRAFSRPPRHSAKCGCSGVSSRSGS